MDIHTNLVTLHPLTFDETERILRFQHADAETWAPGYPSIEQVDYLQAYLVELRTALPRSNWQSQLRRRSDDLVIGGAGVTGPPDARGSVVIGYEIEPSLPDAEFGVAYGVEIVGALLEVAREMGARRATASTRRNDLARQESYARAGLAELSRTDSAVHLAIELP